ncbi:Ig-like domain-containing protein [Brevundimonas sp.]|uniref:Ig-like domain-containing protein n=1 Tax=Brevundimonas sp. TaxID=1871086 RepID=UPI002D241106|nr:Ig-like domain-containing protein [Brevundimonas sp.]HYC98446.1 Ig-like domain-containing protein [Brevundimonas sp.]
MTGYRKLLAGAAALCLLGAALPAAADVQYTYDSAGRLIRAVYSNGVTVTYRYDAAGNRTAILAEEPPNAAPVAVNDAASVAASSSVDINVRANDSDSDGNPLTISSVSSPTGGGSVAILGGGTSVRYTAPATTGAKTFTYTILDGAGGAASATVTVTVSFTNSPPVAAADSASATIDTFQAIMVLANDTDANGHSLAVTAVSTPTGGTASIASGGGHVIYNAPHQAGAYTFTYTVSDGNGGTAVGSVSVGVTTGEAPPDECVPPPGQTECEIQ